MLTRNTTIPSFRHFLFAIVILMTSSLAALSQNVNVSGALVGSGSYPDLGSAFNAINGGAQTGTNIVIAIVGDTTEGVSAVLNSNDWATVTISPTGTRVVTGAIAGHLIDLNGADNVTINGGGTLTISNTDTGSGASTIRFTADASNNTVTNCTVLGSTGAALSSGFGVIYFGTGTTTGNDNNIISSNNIGPAGANLPINGIYSFGTSTAIDNSGNQIQSNNIYDFFNAGGASNGMNVNSANSGWTVTGNSLYQTATRTYTTANTHNGIVITSGSGYTISNNFIGGSAPSAGGTPYAMAGTIATRFVGINVAAGTTAAVNSVQGNTIANITLATTSGATTTNGIIAGINVTSGNFDIGTTTGNTIGSTSVANNIVATSTTSGGLVVGINSSSTGTITIQNNSMGGLSSSGTTAAIAGSITGVNVSGTAAAMTITGNTIGNAAANNMRGGTLGLTTANSLVTGINLPSTPTTATITGNTIQNLSSYGTGTGGFVRGIQTTTSATATAINWSISNNTITNLTTNSTLTGISSGLVSALGIHHLASQGAVISQNSISNVSNINSTATTNIIVAGIVSANATVTTSLGTTITRNRIWNLSNLSVGTTALTPPIVAGIAVRSGNNITAITNNMISLGNAQTSNTSFIGIWSNNGSTPNPTSTNVYFNSVNIEGTAAAGALPSFGYLRAQYISALAQTVTVDVRNNILQNNRNGGTGQHFAISNLFNSTASATGWPANASNFNLLNAAPTTIGHWTSALDFNAWKGSSASDSSSLSGYAPVFVNAAGGDLHLNMGVTATPIESGGTSIAGLTNDFDNNTRPGPVGSVNGGAFAPDIGADEFDGVPLDVSAPSISYTPLLNTSSLANRVINVTLTDFSGVAVGGLAPRIYFNKNAGVYTSTACTLSSGTVNNGVWACTINNSAIGGVVVTDVIRYHVVAQDTLGNLASNPSVGFSGTNVNTVTTPPTTPNQYTIVSAISGTFAVDGVGGGAPNFASLTNAGGVFDYINTNEVVGNIVVNITADLTLETGAVPLNQFATGFTVTIKPSGAPRIVSGPTAGNTGLIRLNGADGVTIDGSLAGGTDRSLTISNTNTTTAHAVVQLTSIGAGQGANNNTVRNTILQGGTDTSVSTLITIGISNGGATPGSTGADNDSATFSNNQISKVALAIYSAGESVANQNQTTIITGNLIGSSAFGADQVWLGGIAVPNTNLATISGNEVRFIGVTEPQAHSGGSQDKFGISPGFNTITNSSAAGVGLTNSRIEKNVIHDIVEENTFSAVGISLSGGIGGGATNNVVANNMIYNVRANGTVSDTSAGIAITSGNGDIVAYNSIYNTGDIDPGVSTTATISSFGIQVTNTTVTSNLTMLNNVSYVDHSSNTGTLRHGSIFIAGTSVFAAGGLNNNDYYVLVTNPQSLVARVGAADYATLALYQAAVTPFETASISADPLFTSATDLRPLFGTPLQDAGVAVPSVLDDIDGNIRSVVGFAGGIPDIGGKERLGPTSSAASISGRVTTAGGNGIRGAAIVVTGNSLPTPIIVKTGSLGYFQVDSLQTGETYVITVVSKRFTFSQPSRVINLTDSINDADFVAEP